MGDASTTTENEDDEDEGNSKHMLAQTHPENDESDKVLHVPDASNMTDNEDDVDQNNGKHSLDQTHAEYDEEDEKFHRVEGHSKAKLDGGARARRDRFSGGPDAPTTMDEDAEGDADFRTAKERSKAKRHDGLF